MVTQGGSSGSSTRCRHHRLHTPVQRRQRDLGVIAAYHTALPAAAGSAPDRWTARCPPGPTGWTAFAGGATAAPAEVTTTLGQGRDAVLITSGGVLAALCGTLLSLPPASVVALNRVVVNASVTTLVVGGSGTSLLTFNDHAHLTGDGRRLLAYR
ncbi:hypothetical protein [Streptomyces sp. NPDC001604]|uniref:hypothetical protein n=1 Tax=Streptomyces sp. NPDC001604 TaxID=3364593 RepID=UPI0036B74052